MDGIALGVGAMPRETDQGRLAQLRRFLADPASNTVMFSRTAVRGGDRADEGYESLLRDLAPVSRAAREHEIKAAMIAALDAGERVTREDAPGDVEMQLDPATYYHFRVSVAGRRLFIKLMLDIEDATLLIMSVKRDDRAWS
jgi:hypothetical protein